MRKLYEATHRGSYLIGEPRRRVRKNEEMGKFSHSPVNNRDRTMPDVEKLKSIDYFKKD